MSVNPAPQIPDYDLDDMVVITTPVQLRALADDLRGACWSCSSSARPR